MKSLHTVLCLAAILMASAAPARTLRHVVVVGVNTSVDEHTPALSFADDDAVRYAEVLAPQAASLHLLTILDPELQQAFPALAAQAQIPTRAAVMRALSTTFSQMEEERRAGHDADLVFVFAGHGGVSHQGEGYVSLVDARLTRTELFAEVIAPSPARFNHIIVDACSAYLLLHRGSASDAARGFLQSADLERHPNTGALLATSRDQATHEWSRVRGGVFSHQVLSALAGAADVDNNSELTYAEVGAFVEAANAGVRDQRARVDVSVSPPRALLARPLWQLGDDARFSLAQQTSGRISIVDARGDVRLDLNKTDEQRLDVQLPGSAPFVMWHGGIEYALVHDAQGWHARTVSSAAPVERGALDEALQRGLYAVPFGRGYVAGYSAQLNRVAASGSSIVANGTSSNAITHTTNTNTNANTTAAGAARAADDVILLPAGLMSGALVAGTAGLLSASYALQQYGVLSEGVGRLTAFEAQDTATRINVATAASVALLGASALAGAGAVWLWP